MHINFVYVIIEGTAEVTAGSLVKKKSTGKMGVIIEIHAPDGSFATWAEVMWSNGSREMLDILQLELITSQG